MSLAEDALDRLTAAVRSLEGLLAGERWRTGDGPPLEVGGRVGVEFQKHSWEGRVLAVNPFGIWIQRDGAPKNFFPYSQSRFWIPEPPTSR